MNSLKESFEKKIPLYGADALGKTDKEEEKCNQTTTQLKQQHAG